MRISRRRSARFSCIGLFSGAGGLDLGLEAAGFGVLAATDAEALCAETYEMNFPKVPYIVSRIGELSPKEIAKTAGINGRGELDLLAGGPPCPAFSKSRFYRTDKPRALADPVAQETIGGYLRVLKELRPKAFILENVKGLAYGVHQDGLETILSSAKRLGYTVECKVVNAADYGAPQIRERCFVMGSRFGRIELPAPTHAKEPPQGSKLKRWVTAGEVLSDIDTEENASDEGHFAGGQFNSLLRLIPPGDNYLYFTAERGHKKPRFKWRSRYWSFLLKLSPELPSWTIQARRSNNMGPFHWRNRILRIEEIKRLQSFPDWFRLAGTVEQQWRQIGNAVPPILAQRFGRAIAQHLATQE